MNWDSPHPADGEPTGLVDPELFVLSVSPAGGRPLALLANYSLHYGGDVGAWPSLEWHSRTAALVKPRNAKCRWVSVGQILPNPRETTPLFCAKNRPAKLDWMPLSPTDHFGFFGGKQARENLQPRGGCQHTGI